MRGARTWRYAALYGVLTLASIGWLAPLATSAAVSLLPLDQSARGWWRADWSTATVDAYVRAWEGGLSGYAVNSVVIAVLSVCLTTVAGSLAAYAFALMTFRLRTVLFVLLITTMVVPVQLVLVPLVPIFQQFGLNQGGAQYLGIALAHTAFGAGWSLFMLMSFFSQIPGEVLEAARLDGASELRVFRTIAAPLALPGIVSFVILDFVFVWNDLLMGLTLLDDAHRPITVGLANLNAPQLNQDDLISAGSVIALLPPLILFAVLNRYYVRGLFAGSVKG